MKHNMIDLNSNIVWEVLQKKGFILGLSAQDIYIFLAEYLLLNEYDVILEGCYKGKTI